VFLLKRDKIFALLVAQLEGKNPYLLRTLNLLSRDLIKFYQ